MANQVESKKNPPRKMKVLKTSQEYFAFLGISSEKSRQKLFFNYKILMGFILLGYSLVAHFVYSIYVVKSFDKCIECICGIFATVVITTCFATMVFGMRILFESIDSIENLIETSEYKSELNWSTEVKKLK